MAAKDRNALKSGLFIIVTIAAIIAIVVAIQGLGEWSQPSDVRAVWFSLKDDVGGLQVGDDVRVGGYKVGVVRGITVGRFGKTADSIAATGDHATQLVDDARGQVKPAMEKYQLLADRAAETMVKIRDFFGDTTSDFRATMASLKSITATIEQKTPG